MSGKSASNLVPATYIKVASPVPTAFPSSLNSGAFLPVSGTYEKIQYQIIQLRASVLQVHLNGAASFSVRPQAIQALNPSIHRHKSRATFSSNDDLLSSSTVVGAQVSMETLSNPTENPVEVFICAHPLAEIRCMYIEGTYIFHKTSFLACTDGVVVEPAGMFSVGMGSFVECSGKGVVFLAAIGGLLTLTLAANEHFVVENSHIAAIPDGIRVEVVNLSRGKDGFGVSFTGPGKVFVQAAKHGPM